MENYYVIVVNGIALQVWPGCHFITGLSAANECPDLDDNVQ